MFCGSALICAVCGDTATSFNFDAICCEGCKSFFRRNGLRAQELVCIGNGNCPIERGTRNSCPACRMRRCLAAGMKLEFLHEVNRRATRTKRNDSRLSSSEDNELRQSDEKTPSKSPRRGRIAHASQESSSSPPSNVAPARTSSESPGRWQSSTASETAPTFVHKVKRFLHNNERGAEAEPHADVLNHTMTEAECSASPSAVVLNAPDGVGFSNISLSSVPNLSSAHILSAMANELDAPLNSSVSTTRTDPPKRPEPTQLQPFQPLQPYATGPASSSPLSTSSSSSAGASHSHSQSLCPTCHQMRPASQSQSQVATPPNAGDLPATPEMLVTTSIREPPAAQRLDGVDSVVVVECRHALTPGANLLLAGSNSVYSSVATPAALIPNEQMGHMLTNMADCIRLMMTPLNEEEASSLRELIRKGEFSPLPGILFQRIIRSLKLIPEFRAFTQDKQMRLIRADMTHIFKTGALLCYDLKKAAFCPPVLNGPPIYYYSSDLLKKIDRLGMPFSRQYAFTTISFLELFGVFDSDPLVIYVLLLLALFSPHKFLPEPAFVSELLPVYARYAQFFKQYILSRYENELDHQLPRVNMHYLFSNAPLQSSNSTGPTQTADVRLSNAHVAAAHSAPAFAEHLSSIGSSSVLQSDVNASGSGSASEPFAHRLLEFGLRVLDWLFVSASAPLEKESSRRLAELELLDPLVIDILELDGVRPPAAASQSPSHS